MKYTSEKIISGFTACFRQYKAESHCNKLHGYALEFKVVYGCEKLDKNNWCQDFGDLKQLKNMISYLFDHTTVVANHDPEREIFKEMHKKNIIDLRFLTTVGCEAFAKVVFELAESMIKEERVFIESVTCYENKTNSATYKK